jgi:hypothetical protein
LMLQNTLKKLFSGRQYFHSLEGVRCEEVSRPGSVWVLSRAHTIFQNIDLRHLDSKDRSLALSNVIQIQSPFEEPSYWVSWEKGIAMVWSWDKRIVEEAILENLLEADDLALVDILPESIFYSSAENGLQIFESMDGIVGQRWLDGVLRSETLWRNSPNEADLDLFARSSGLEARPIEIPTVKSHPQAWGFEEGAARKLKVYEPLIFTCASLLLVVFLSLEGARWIGLNALIWSANYNINATKEEVRPALEERRNVLNLRSENQALASLMGNSQLEMMAAIVREIPQLEGGSDKIQSWQSEPGMLQFRIHKPKADLQDYATAFDQVSFFGDISLVPNDRADTLEIKASLEQ